MPFLYIPHPFMYQVSVHQVPATMEIISQDLCMYVVMFCSLAKSGRLICIARSWEFRFTMLTSGRVKQFTGYSGKMCLGLSKCFARIGRLVGLRRMAVLLHEVAAGREATVDCDFLHHFCIISLCKTTLRTSILHFVPCSCVPAFTVAPSNMST